MALTATVQQAAKPVPTNSTPPSNDLASALLSMIMLSVYGAQMSKKTVRRLKRKFFWTSLKLKFKSLFKPKPQQRVSDRTLIWIIAAVAFVVLLIVSPITALVLALVLLILYLAGVI